MKAWKFIPHQKKLHFRKKKVKGPGPLTPPPVARCQSTLESLHPEEEATKRYLI